MNNPRVRTIVSALLALAMGACEGGVLPTEGGSLMEIRIEPQPARVELEGKLQLDARITDALGNVVNGRRVFWTSENASIASVSETGEVTGHAPGTTRVAASADGMSGIGTITVVPKAVMRVTVTPERLSLVAGESASLSAVALDRDGKPLDGRAVTWTSGDAKVAQVDGSGRVTAVAAGSVVVRATVEGINGESSLTVSRKPVETVEVTPPTASLTVGESVQLAATARAADGSPVEGVQALWSSGNPDAVMVTETGVAVAVGAGSAVVTAQVDGQSGSASISVTPKPVATLEISPTTAQLVVRGTQQFTATPKAADGTALTGRAIAWTTTDAAVATVDANGLVTAVAVGQTTVRASTEGKSADASLVVSPVPVATVEVVPGNAQVLAGASQQLTAVARDANGVELSGRVATWSSSDVAVATVTATGQVTGVVPGGATITASIEGKTATANITVLPVPVYTVEVSPTSASLVVGGTRQFEATTKSSSGAVLLGRGVTWTSSAPAVASVSTAGLVTAHTAGQATITATSEGVSGSAVVTVTPTAPTPVATVTVTPSASPLTVGGTAQLTATLKAADGTVLTGRTVTWSSSATAVATVSTSGLVTAVSAGSATITATSEGKSGTASVTVAAPQPVATVTVTPSSTQLVVGGTAQLSATLRASDGTVLTGRTVTWSSTAPGFVSVSSTGLVTALSVGTSTITATSEGKSGSASVTVIVLPVATVTVTPSAIALLVGGTAQLSATLKAADGTTLTGRTVTWTTSASGVATVSTTGLVTANGAGQATITATSEGKSGSASVTVTLPPVATVTVSPSTVQIVDDDTAQLTATLKAADGTTLTGRTITWTSSASAIATVNSTGRVTAKAPGQATITATSEGQSGSASVTVLAKVDNVTVTPSSAQLVVGGTAQFTATLKAANGATLTGRPITWSSTASSVASVSSTGLVTAHAAGTTTIRATSEGKTGSASVTVTVAPVATVTVTPSSVLLTVGGTAQLSATLKAADGTTLTGRSVTWTTSASGVASVSSSGLVTAKAVGLATITATSEGKSGSAVVTVSVAEEAAAADGGAASARSRERDR